MVGFRVLSGCLWGLLPPVAPPKGIIVSKQAFVGAHHQFVHNAELLMVLAFGYPFLNLSKLGLYLSFVFLQIGAWCNPIAYMLRTVTGSGMYRTQRYHP